MVCVLGNSRVILVEDVASQGRREGGAKVFRGGSFSCIPLGLLESGKDVALVPNCYQTMDTLSTPQGIVSIFLFHDD